MPGRRVIERNAEEQRHRGREILPRAKFDEVRDAERQAADAVDDGLAGLARPAARTLQARPDLARQWRVSGKRCVHAFEYEGALPSFECRGNRFGRERPQRVDAKDTHLDLVMLADEVGCATCGLDGRALRDQDGCRVVHPVTGHCLVLAAGLAREFRERIVQGFSDETVEKRATRKGPECETSGVEQGAGEYRLVEVVPGRDPVPRIAEQQPLRFGGGAERVIGGTEQGTHLCRRQQAHVLGCERSLFAIHDDHDGDERFLRDASPDIGEVDGLLDVGGEQYAEPCVGAEVHGLVPGAWRRAVCRGGACAYVQDQRHVFAGSRNQQVL